MTDVIRTFLMQVLRQSPMLLVCLVGLIAALALMRRCAPAGVLLLLGAGLFLLSLVGFTFAFQFILHSYDDWGWDGEKLDALFTILGLVNSLLHATSLALLMGAAFVGRAPRATKTPAAGSPFA